MAGDLLEHANQTYLHPLGLAMLLILGMLLQVVPRKLAPVPILIMATFVSPAQRIAIFQMDFDFTRMMVVFGLIRIALRGEYRAFRWNRLDTVVTSFAVMSAIMYTVQWRGAMSAFIHQMGSMVDSAGMYFIFRVLVRDLEDLRSFARAIAIIAIPVAGAFTIEWLTRYNMFSIFGRVPAITEMRQGKLRCQGPFPHPIIAGCFWAAVAPIAASLWWSRGSDRTWAVLGTMSAVWIVFTTTSSTPMGALMAGAAVAFVYPFRKHMREIRWLIVAACLFLHFMMKGPLWSIFAKVDLVGGSTGWHRYHIIDQGINNLNEWWLDGTRSTAHWGWGTFDITNHYLFVGVRGGLICLFLFIAILAYGFQSTGRFRASVEPDKAKLALAWGLGVALFVHLTNFFGTSYFGQINVALFATLGVIGSMRPHHVRQPRPTQTRQPARRRPTPGGPQPDAGHAMPNPTPGFPRPPRTAPATQ